MLTAIIILNIILISIILFLIFKKKENNNKDKDIGLQLILQQINDLSKNIDNKIGETHKQVWENIQFHSKESNKIIKDVTEVSNRIIKDVTEKLTIINETNKQVISFADQLQNLQDILKNPKQRGILGEYFLETLLKNVLPVGSYQMQYSFPNGTIVDAAVFIKDKIIPIDSKFSLENYNRIVEESNPSEKKKLEGIFLNDLKTRIIETSKYIQPTHGTTDFAFMFIPHEAIYYDLLINKIGQFGDENNNLIQQAVGKYKVIIVSPTSFLAYLQTVLQGLRALHIEESAKEIAKKVQVLGKHLNAYDQFHTKLGGALGIAVNHYNASNKELQKIDKDILKITNESPELSVLELEKPNE